MTKKLGLRGAAIAAVLLALPAMAVAQNYPPPGGGGPPGPGVAPTGPQRDARGFWPRRGIYGGLGLGFGGISADCQGCRDDTLEGVGFHFNIGWHLNPQIGLFLDGYGVGADPELGVDALLIHSVATLGVQFWVTPPLWLKAGLGSSQQSFQSDEVDIETDTVPGILLAAGYEILHSPNFSVDIGLRVASGFYEEDDGGTVTNVGLQFSVNWHALFTHAVVVVH